MTVITPKVSFNNFITISKYNYRISMTTVFHILEAVLKKTLAMEQSHAVWMDRYMTGHILLVFRNIPCPINK